MKVPRGLYAITSDSICASGSSLLAAVAAALAGGAAMVQYRDKVSAPEQREHLAQELAALCRAHGVPLIVNDDPQLAQRAGAQGVHLGRDDAPLAQARALLGPDAIIGATCGNSLERALSAAQAGADYVAFGRFFASRTKPGAALAELALLARARTALDLPLCAIGGITPGNAATVIQAGADLVAAVEGVFAGADVRAAARAYAVQFAAPRPGSPPRPG